MTTFRMSSGAGQNFISVSPVWQAERSWRKGHSPESAFPAYFSAIPTAAAVVASVAETLEPVA